jgi:hypothetical protein
LAPAQIVRTKALAKQQEESLSPPDAWWIELLQTGVLEGSSSSSPDKAVSNKYEVKIMETDATGWKKERTVWREGLYDQARRISPKLRPETDHKLGRYLSKQGCVNIQVQRGRRGWKFPPLQECRDKWKQRFPETVWHDKDTTKWTYPYA